MKTIVCLAVVAVLLACVLSVEAKSCTKPCTQLVRVRELVTYRYYFWGRMYYYKYYTWVYRMRKTTCYIPCPVHCEWGPWVKDDNGWGKCSVTCGIGNEQRINTRRITTEAAHGGEECKGSPQWLESRSCDMKKCPATICKEEKTGLHTHLQICSKFVHCDNSKAHVKSCAEGTAWDNDKKTCSSDSHVVCEGITCLRGLIYPHETDCSKYYKCDHNTLNEVACPSDRPYWDVELHRCASDNKATCDKRAALRERSYQPEELTCDVDELIVDTEDCKKYYVCVHGKPISMSCAPGAIFDVDDLECVHGTCENDIEPETCKEGTFTVDESNPNVYYQCDNGKKVEKNCPQGLVFNKKTCDWPNTSG